MSSHAGLFLLPNYNNKHYFPLLSTYYVPDTTVGVLPFKYRHRHNNEEEDYLPHFKDEETKA